jgi:CelD/BcsL family acetyltransferase involved in cellulose biosynthesis
MPELSATVADGEESITRTALTVSVHRELDAVLAAKWDVLYANLKTPSLFQHRAWYQAYLDAYAPHLNAAEMLGEVFFIMVEQDGRALAILPLYYREYRRLGCPIRCLGLLWNTDLGVRDLPLLAGGERSPVLATALRSAGIRWDIMELHDLAADSSALRAFTNFAGFNKLALYHHDSNRLRSVAGGRDQCLSLISKDHIKKTRKKWRKLEQQGAITCEILRDAVDIQSGFDTFLAIEDAGWKGSNGNKTSLLCDPPQRGLYQTLLSQSFPGLQPRIALLKHNGNAIAANLCVQAGDTLFLLKISYDDQYQEHSPGNLLLLYLLEQYSDVADINYLSFITGGDWTHRWSPERIPVYRCTIYNKTGAGLVAGTLAQLKNELRKLKHRFKKPAAKNI